jgi:N-acetylglucosaminyldiphosphoundecaprenol N-acetyl-beta-D-mannosaminyltransferase
MPTLSSEPSTRAAKNLPNPNSPFPEYDVCGLKVHSVTTDALLQFVDDSIRSEQLKIVFGYSLTIIPKLKETPIMFELANAFDVLIPDGKGFFWLSSLLGAKMAEHISLPDFAQLCLTHASNKRYSVLLLGATPELNAAACEYVRRTSPNVKAVFGVDGYFKDADEPALIEKINAWQPDIILIGISSPKKEILATKLKSVLTHGILVPCGGVLDIFGGKTTREPVWMKKLGLAWIYRFLLEPKRLFKPVLLNGLNFIFVVIPTVLWQKKVLRNPEFTFQKFFGAKR